jgi:hypothetical protein
MSEISFEWNALDEETRLFIQGRTVAIIGRLGIPPENILRVRRFNSKQFYSCQIAITTYVRFADDKQVVYALCDPRNFDVFYVGKTSRLLSRLKSHCMVHRGPRMSRLDTRKLAIYQEGLPVGALVLRICETADEADEWEQRFIDRYWKTTLNAQRNKWIQERKFKYDRRNH